MRRKFPTEFRDIIQKAEIMGVLVLLSYDW
jgi:hypothetical protein